MSPGLRLAGAIVWGLLGIACGAEDAPRILLIGDSITAGQMSAPAGTPFAAQLADRLAPGYEIVNVACGGTSSLDWAPSRGARFCGGEIAAPSLYEVRVRPALPAALAVVMLGTNDAYGVREQAPVASDAYRAALRELVAALRADGVPRMLLMTPPPIFGRPWVGVRAVGYGLEVQALCRELEGVDCGPDVLRLLDVGDFAPGNRHPNASGHDRIAEALVASIRSLEPTRAASHP